MIVISTPRSGGTKFCLDLSEKLNLPYKGDLQLANTPEMGSSWHIAKAQNHETNTGGAITVNDLASTVSDYKNNIVLLNMDFVPMLPFADVYLIRKNKRNIFTSMVNYMMKIGNGTLPGFFNEATLYKRMVECKVYDEYLKQNNITPTYYEDYFNNYPHHTPILNEHPEMTRYLDFIDSTMQKLEIV